MTRATTFNPIRAIVPPHAPACSQSLIEVDGEHFIISANHAARETVAFRATADGKFATSGTGEPDLFDATHVGGTDIGSALGCVAKLLEYLRARPADAQATADDPQTLADAEQAIQRALVSVVIDALPPALYCGDCKSTVLRSSVTLDGQHVDCGSTVHLV